MATSTLDLPAAATAPLGRDRWVRRAWWIFLAGVSWVPLLTAKPGQLMADTKIYLYLNPTKLLSSAQSMWNPDVGMGTVTHQNIGYLFPMGPYYWLVHTLNLPMWLGQRLWMGALIFTAGAGVYRLARELGIALPGQVAAAMAYALTPYIIDYIARISAMLMPWAGLPWMLLFTIWAARRGGWRYPALFAVVVAFVSGVNATSILFVGLAPVIWLLYACAVTREVKVRAALLAALKIGLLSALVCLWWAAGLWAEGAYGINILKYTETFATVTMTSLASEVLRGLGYWYFYGQDKLQPWTAPAGRYMLSVPVQLTSFGLPLVMALLGMLARWRYRLFAATLVLVGIVLAVGAYPLEDPTPLGRAIKAAGEGSTIGLAMRSSNRVVPIIVLGLALLLGSGLTALAGRWHRSAWVASGLAVVLAMANLPGLFDGSILPGNLASPERLPSYVRQTASYLNANGKQSSVLAIPGSDFAYYNYGVTMDSVWPGLLNRPFIGRQAVVQGQAASVNLLRALDESIQDGVFDPSTVAPMARLMGAGDVLLQSDLQVERFGLPRPQALWLQMQPTPAGLTGPTSFGKPGPLKTFKFPLMDETQLAIPLGASQPPPLAVYGVNDPRPQLRTESPSDSMLMAGDGNGLLEASAAGLLSGNPFIAYSASLPVGSKALAQLLASKPSVVMTDTNARRLDAWGTLHDTYGYVMQASDPLSTPNPQQQPMPVTQGGASTQTVARYQSIASVHADSYANPITNEPENQPSRAFDQIPATSWTEGAFTSGVGANLTVRLKAPVAVDHITVLQPQNGSRNRWVTKVTVIINGKHRYGYRLTSASREEPGQALRFPLQSLRSLRLRIDMTNRGIRKSYVGFSGVGFAEVTIPGVGPARESLRLPTDVVTKAGTVDSPLVVLTSRLRAPIVPPRFDPELVISRVFSTAVPRSFSVSGQLRASPLISDAMINTITGRANQPPGLVGGGQVAIEQTNSLSRINGGYRMGSWESADGRLDTSWTPAFGPQEGRWLTYDFARPITVDHLNLQLVNDGRHSQVRQLEISAGGVTRTVDVPKVPLGRGRPIGATTEVPVSFPAVSGQQLRVTLSKVHLNYTRDYVGGLPIPTPVAIAEIGIAGVAEAPTPAQVPGTCYPAMLSIDGQLVGGRAVGSTADALDGRALQLQACGGGYASVTLSRGNHQLEAESGEVSGWNVDSLNLSSATGGGALQPQANGQLSLPTAPALGPVATTKANRSGRSAHVPGDQAGRYLVFGQSYGPGWTATANGRSLGKPILADGFAMAWRLPDRAPAQGFNVALQWTPQRRINLALIASLVGLALIVVLAVFGRGRRRRVLEVEPEPPTLTSLLRYEGGRPRWWVGIALASGLGLLSAVIFTPWAGLAIGLGTLTACLLRWTRLLAVVSFVGLLGASGYLVVAGQRTHGYLWNIEWPDHFHLSSQLTWAAICVLLADAAVSHLYQPKGEEPGDG